jgi:hypothetical protein
MKRACIFLSVIIAFPAMAQLTLLPADLLQPVLNERGAMLTFENQGYVQFLDVSLGVFPPNVDGSPHPDNPVVGTAFVGQGMVLTNPSSVGLFSVSVDQSSDGPIMARIFNAATAEAASFYADAQTITIPAASYIPVFGNTTNALDTGDDDGDGLNNSWEKSLGSNPTLADSDGDGVSDLQEFLAGTDLDDEGSFLAVSGIIPQAGGLLTVQWYSVSGKSYQVQGTDLDLMHPQAVFSNINDVVTASGFITETHVTNGWSSGLNQFRIKLVE